MILLVSVKIIPEAWEQNLECILLFFHRELFHTLIIQEIHLLEKLSVRALWGHLLLHHGAENVFICQVVSCCSHGIQCPAQNQVWKSVQSIKSTQN